MSLTRGEIAGFFRAYKWSGKTKEEAIASFKEWLSSQNDAVASAAEKEKILDDLASYQY